MEKATKICPFCGKEILDVAKKCRYCGEWLNSDSKTSSYINNSNSNDTVKNIKKSNIVSPTIDLLNTQNIENLKERKEYLILSIVLGIAAAFSIIFFVCTNKSNSDSTSVDQISAEIDYEPLVVEADDNDTHVENITEQPAIEPEIIPEENKARQRYKKAYDDVYSGDIRIMRADGSKIWYNHWEQTTGFSNKLFVYDSETDYTKLISLNKTSQEDDEMNVTDMVENNGVITIIMVEDRNSNGWTEGTYVWQYNCYSDSWKCLARACAGAEFINNRTVVKIDNVKCLNPDDFTYLQRYKHEYKNIKL